MTDPRRRAVFEAFVGETLARGRGYWWRPRGMSMAPAVRDGERVLVVPTDPRRLRVGEIVKFEAADGFRMHRLIRRSRREDGTLELAFRGDNSPADDPTVGLSRVVGVAAAVERQGRIRPLDTWRARLTGRLKILKRHLREHLRTR